MQERRRIRPDVQESGCETQSCHLLALPVSPTVKWGNSSCQVGRCGQDRHYGSARAWHQVDRGWIGSFFFFLINYTSFPSASPPGLKSYLPYHSPPKKQLEDKGIWTEQTGSSTPPRARPRHSGQT